MSRRKVVQVNVPNIRNKIKQHGWSASTFCRMMDRSVTWVSGWKYSPPRNLPSPEEAARMCAILGVEPAEILTEPEEITTVAALIDAERLSSNQPAKENKLAEAYLTKFGELSEENQKKVVEYIELLLKAQLLDLAKLLRN